MDNSPQDVLELLKEAQRLVLKAVLIATEMNMDTSYMAGTPQTISNAIKFTKTANRDYFGE